MGRPQREESCGVTLRVGNADVVTVALLACRVLRRQCRGLYGFASVLIAGGPDVP